MSRFAGSTALAGTLLLAGCSAPAEAESVSAQAEVSTPAPDAGDCQPGGPGVEGLNVTTDTTAPPEITHTEALTPSTTERLVVVEGSGEEVKENDRVMVAYAYFNGATGEKIGHIGYDDVGPDMIPADPEAPYLIGLFTPCSARRWVTGSPASFPPKKPSVPQEPRNMASMKEYQLSSSPTFSASNPHPSHRSSGWSATKDPPLQDSPT